MKEVIQNNDNGLFYGLSPETIEAVLDGLQDVQIPKGEPIITENNPGGSLFYIVSGKVEINKGLNDMETPFAQLSVLEPGDCFGEMSIINDAPRSATVVALEDTKLLVIPKEIFLNITFSHPIVMYNLIRMISGRLRSTNDKFIELMNQMISKNRLEAIGMAASKIIHDIKTPLTVIVLTAQLMESCNPANAKLTETIISQTKQIDQLVREILDFAKGTEGTPLVQKIDLDAFFQDIKNTYGTSLQGRQINFVVENNVHDFVHFDETKLRRVILNLLKNSSEAIGETGEIRIHTNYSSNWLQISVIDDGPGVSEKIKDELFQPFVSEGKEHGTGLGLAICKKLIQEHRGRMEYIPVKPHGARFDIRIPQTAK